MRGGKARERKINGLILPVEWDESDRIIGVVIETADEESFIVEADKKGRELLNLIHHEIEATGSIRKGEYGNMYIKVKSYAPVERKPDLAP